MLIVSKFVNGYLLIFHEVCWKMKCVENQIGEEKAMLYQNPICGINDENAERIQLDLQRRQAQQFRKEQFREMADCVKKFDDLDYSQESGHILVEIFLRAEV